MKTPTLSAVLACVLASLPFTASADILHRYSFTSDARDSVGTANGALVGGAAIAGGAVALNGSSGYVNLPNGLFSNLTSITIEVWLINNGSGNWARIYDLGSSTAAEDQAGSGTRYMFLTPGPGPGTMRGAYTVTGGGAGEQIINWPGASLPTGVMKHVVWVTDGNAQTGRLYVDGVLVGSNDAMTIKPSDLEPSVNNWIGRSQWSGDAFLNASITEFRIYDSPLGAAQIVQNFQAGPDISPLSGPVTITTQPQNTTVNEQQMAIFSTTFIGAPPVLAQWFKNGASIPGATNAAYSFPAATADNGAVFSVALTNTVTNVTFFTLSSNAVLTVVTDTVPPTVSGLLNVVGSLSNVALIYSEPVEAVSATNLANYSFANGLPIYSASLGSDRRTVAFVTGSLVYGSNYTLVISNVRDRATTPNTIVPNTAAGFGATFFTSADIGGAAPAGGFTNVANDFDLTGSGGDIGGTADQFNFTYGLVAGDFDLQVRVQALSRVDLWTKAGLVARETLATNSRFAGVLATPASAGSFFEYRPAVGSNVTMSGSFPPNFPYSYLRLQRAGDVFTGFASYDGQSWTVLGTASLPLTNTLYFGMALASHINGQRATAQLHDFGAPAGTALGAPADTGEPLGPSTRRTGLVISEIMYKPAARADSNNLEFIELYNSNPYYHDISGYRLSGSVSFTFPANTIIAANSFMVVAAAPAAVQSVYGLSQVFGPYASTNDSLKNSGTLRLRDEQDSILLEVDYRNTHPWPMGADGTGHAIVLARPSYGENDPSAWAISEVVGGSPGAFEVYRPSPLRNLFINEVLANAGASQDFVEIYNHSNQTNDLSGCFLSDSPDTNKFVFPSGTKVPPRGFLVLSQSQFGFGLKAGGDTIYLRNRDNTRVLDAVRFDAQQEGVSFGRWPDGANDFYRLSALSAGTKNGPIAVSEVVINELMYHPISQSDEDQYIELYNQGANEVSLGGWKLADGVSFTFPSNAVIAAGGYFVVARNMTNLLAKYPALNLANTAGGFGGTLAGNGERVALSRPFANYTVGAGGQISTNILNIVVDEVTYSDGGRWGEWSDGGGSSLELVDPRSDHRLPSNWADSDETSKAPWTTIEFTGTLDNGVNYDPAITNAQIGVVDPGECLIDNVEVRPGGTGGVNVVANPGLDSGLTGWSLLGCFSRSSLEIGGGSGGGNALHLRTRNRLFTMANSAQAALNATPVLASGANATLRFQARWLKGCRDMVMRLSGNWLEASGSLSVPANLGTPGQRNSRAVTNAGPALYAVTHSPAMPSAGQVCAVMARVSDLDGVAGGTLNYRIDPSSAVGTATMLDDGTGGDVVAGDGLFTAQIPAQSAGTIVAFWITAADSLGAAVRYPELLNDNAPVRECLVRFGEPQMAMSFASYHLWVSQTNVNRWIALPVLSNEDMDATFVTGGRVIYNVFVRYAGSPYHQAFNSPLGPNACHYNMEVPRDDKFLGHASFNKLAWIGNDIQDDSGTVNSNDSTLQREQTANTFLRGLGQPWVYRRFFRMQVNGVQRGQLMEDALRPSVSVPDEYFPNDTGGYLYKFQPWFEGGPAAQGNYWPWANESWCYLNNFVTAGGAKKTARYRWWYEPRQSPDTLNNFTNVFTLVDAAAASASPNYVAFLENVADMENWMRLVAANHAAGNWDCYGIQNGQNIYGYVSPQKKWTLFMFDFNIVLGNRISWAPGAELFTVTPDYWVQIYNNPTFRRMLLRAYKELVAGPMQASAYEPLLDAKYAAFQANGVTATPPQVVKDWIASARVSIASQMAPLDTANFAPTAGSFTTATNLVTLTGAAPLAVVTLLVNGESFTPVWTSTTHWLVRLPLPFGTNVYSLVGLDRNGQPVAGATNSVTLANTGLPESPESSLVFNEIAPNPPAPDGEFIELFNQSTNTAFDLSGWSVNGLSYTFPTGSVILPRQYLVLARSRTEFANLYGAANVVFGDFGGNLQHDGETLTLLKPGALPGEEVVIDRVRYEGAAPWPPGSGSLPSLQLVDPLQDDSRVGNWSDGSGWRYFSFTGTIGSSRLSLFFDASGGDIYLDDLTLVPGSAPGVGVNAIVNGGFEAALSPPWVATGITTNSHVTNGFAHSGNGSLHYIQKVGAASLTSFYQDVNPAVVTNTTFTLSGWYQLGAGTNRAYTLRAGSTFQAKPDLRSGATPGASNVAMRAVPPFPSLWLNEVQPVNFNGVTDNLGEREPWIELFNPGTAAVSLAGCFLSDNYVNLAQWAFPSDAVIHPGQFLVVWADGQTNQSGPGNLHTSFRINSGTGAVALSRTVGEAPQILDYLNFSAVPADWSYGAVPDGQPFYRYELYYPTPGNTNNAASPPLVLRINEWMAANTSPGGFPDPADGDYDDWFELYNPGPVAVDLAGYYLTDTLTNQFQFRIPDGYTIPAGGFLLVWADNETGQNTTNRPDLHVSFALRQAGEAIGLFAADGNPIDTVTFGPQTNNISEGHYPDGNGPRYFMPTDTPRMPNEIPNPPQEPELSGVQIVGGDFSFTISTTPGRTYQVFYKDDLSQPDWLPLGAPQPAGGTALLIADPVGAHSQRFYTVLEIR